MKMVSTAEAHATFNDDNLRDYAQRILELRKSEYPALKGVYLDHAGTTPIPRTLMQLFTADMISNLYGNPHSGSPSSQLATQRIENIRHDALRFFHADPLEYDLVFVANATAGLKLLGEALRDGPCGFELKYHVDSHTSLVGLREWAHQGSVCFRDDVEVEEYLDQETRIVEGDEPVQVFAFPAQSNMNGRRLPLSWCERLRKLSQGAQRRYSLLDAAALVSTSPLDLSNADMSPDFIVLSFYKIFGFPDLGALIVKKEAASVLKDRKYFGGGTVDMALALKEQWHSKKTDSIHVGLEDGSLPIHSIIALGHAIKVHRTCFGSMHSISKYTSFLTRRLYEGLQSLRHGNGLKLCEIYIGPSPRDATSQGPILAFNMVTSRGAWVSSTEVEKLASIHDIHLRVGGLCNPGGIASSLKLEPWEMMANFTAGFRCGSENDIVGGKPTGMVRVSLGAMSTLGDGERFVDFLREFFVDSRADELSGSTPFIQYMVPGEFCVENLLIYPIKSCAGWRIPSGLRWHVNPEGLAFDREWCLVHSGTEKALSQKEYPRMALIRPEIDLARGVLRVRSIGAALANSQDSGGGEVSVPLSSDPSYFESSSRSSSHAARVCGDTIEAQTYVSKKISSFFSAALGVPCELCRLPARQSTRHAKTGLQRHDECILGRARRPLLLSNESPILVISRASVNRLNEQIKVRGGKAIQAEAFRPNIVVCQHPDYPNPGAEQPYVEDSWRVLRIGKQYYEMLGSCHRCSMVCVDQETAEKHREPFATLAKTRRRLDGRVYFGQHAGHLGSSAFEGSQEAQSPSITVGDVVTPLGSNEADVMLHLKAAKT